MNGKAMIVGVILLLCGLGGGYYIATHFSIVPAAPITTPTPPLVGGDRDSHGCIGSAGYSWCEIKQKCLRTWEEPCKESSPTPSVDETEIIKAAMKKAIVAKRGTSANDLTYTVSKIIGNHAQGGASAPGGGAMWLASKVNGEWKLVWDGNGTIDCVDIEPYGFPTSMVPECWNSTTNKSIKR